MRLFLRKLGSSEHDRYANYILPKHPRDYNFDETVETLRQIFGEQISLFNMCFNCLKITKSDSTDFSTYADIVNRECEWFKITSIIDAQFKCLIFVCGLKSVEDANIRTRILPKIEQIPDVILQQVECQCLINLKHDSTMVQQLMRLTLYKNNTIPARHQHLSSPHPLAGI